MNGYKFKCPYCGENRLFLEYYVAVSIGAIHLENNHGDEDLVELGDHIVEVGVVQR